MKKILFVHFGENHIRGSERCLIDLISHMDRTRFNPILWCNSNLLAEHIRNTTSGVDVIVDEFVVLFGYTNTNFSIIKNIGLRRKARELIINNSIDLVHANSAAPCQWMSPVCKLLKIPIVCHLHSPYLPRNRITLRVHETSALIGVSENILLGWRSDGYKSERINCIHNGVDARRLNQDPPWPVTKHLNIPDTNLVLATVCSLVHRKGIDLLISSLAIFVKGGGKAHLLVIGSGPERENLSQLAEKEGVGHFVHFLGERDDVGAILRGGVDILVSGAREEAFGLTLVEAAFLSLPVSAYAVTGIPEVVLHNKTGLLARADDCSEMARHWKLLSNLDTRVHMGEAAKLRAETEFSIHTYVDRVSRVWSRLLEESPIFGGIPWRGLVSWFLNKIKTHINSKK